MHSVKVTLPLSMALDPVNSNHVCPYKVAKKVTTGPVPCPKGWLIGSATAVTPLLSKPLSGNVYLVQGIKIVHGHKFRTLPTLLVALRGQIAFDLRGLTWVNKKNELATSFPAIPDAPVSKFDLTIKGESKGNLSSRAPQNVCNKAQIAHATLRGQNGKSERPAIHMSTPCTSH